MATRAEYIAGLNNQFPVVSNIIRDHELDPALSNDGEITAYEAFVYRELESGAMQGVVIPFYVIHEGEGDEYVLPVNQVIENKPVNLFKPQITTYLNNNFLSAPENLEFVINEVNLEKEFVIFTGYIYDSATDTVSTRRFFLRRDGSSNVSYSEFLG